MLPFFSRHPLGLFFVLVFIVEWAAVLALAPLSPMTVGVIALVPAPVALLASALVEGRKGPGRLLRRSLEWQTDPKWYALAILIPTAIHLLAAIAAVIAGATLVPRPEALLAFLPLTLILAVGEEIGWQGYALPRLRTTFSSLPTAVIFGIVHASFHLPMFLLPLPDELRQASPYTLFLLMATAFAVYRVWFFDHVSNNVPLIVVYHASINISVLLLNGVERELLGWLLPGVWSLATLIFLATGIFFKQPQPRAGLLNS